MANLNFNDKIRRMPQKALGNNALSQDLIMVKIQVIDAVYNGEGAYPYKLLPVMSVSSELPSRMGSTYGKEGVVIPKGTIVSFLTNQTTVETYSMADMTSSGTLPWFQDQLDGGNYVYTSIDDKFFGYDMSVNSLLVPANGGSQSEIPYSALDTEIGLWNDENDSNLVLSANIPVGIVMTDVYQDIRGAYLNYQSHDMVTPVKSGRFAIPYIDTTKVAFGSASDVTTDTDSGYYRLWRKWQFLTFASGSSQGRAGMLLTSDAYGKFVPQGNGTTAVAKTVQSVGSLITTDSRFPKDLENMVQYYPNLETLTGVPTNGIPTDLYIVAQETLEAAGLGTDKTTILQYIQDGAFGMARIQLAVMG